MTLPPLSGHRFGVGRDSVGTVAAGLLTSLGATVESGAPATDVESELWAASGLGGLCGRAGGPALAPAGRPATLAAAAGRAIGLISGHTVDVLPRRGERVAMLGLSRRGAMSAGGAARLLPTTDGWLVLNLPRPSDIELLPALIEGAVGTDHWSDVVRWCSTRTTHDALERCLLLGLAAGAVPSRESAGKPLVPWALSHTPSPPRQTGPLTVVNLGSLWAAPLCANLLSETGCLVVDVESTSRPDTSPPDFYAAVHAGHRRVILDLREPRGREQLGALLAEADVVIEASRPRALEAFGAPAELVMADGRSRVWLRITGHDRASGRIAFGDDAAASGGLLGWDADGPVFAGDAIADPLTGIVGALIVTSALQSEGSWIADLSMTAVARYAALL